MERTGRKGDGDAKVFYSIEEVAARFGVRKSTLRYWEQVFGELRPLKTPGGTRCYREEDVRLVGLIYHLVKVRKLTLAGAARMLKEQRGEAARDEELARRLALVRDELMALLEAVREFEGNEKNERNEGNEGNEENERDEGNEGD
jgi:DNA-binding transcriptional MerR regulator